MKTLALAALLLAACTTEDQPATSQAMGEAVVEMCGPAPKIPTITPKFVVIDGENRATLSPADYDAMMYYVGINALWQSCVTDLP